MAHGDYSCCCGSTHVRTGALIIGILVVIFGILGIISSIVSGLWPNAIGCAISILTGALIIFADRTEREWGYLPYIILSGIGIVIYALAIIAFIILGIIGPTGLEDWFKIDKDKDIDDIKTAVRIACFIYAAILIVVEIFAIWFWTVVFKAYKYMRDVICCGQAHGSYA